MVVEKICVECGKVFNVKECQAEKRKFCSRACHNEWMKKHNPRGKDHHSYTGYVTLICEECGKEFQVKPYCKTKGQRFCSKECGYKAGGLKRRSKSTDLEKGVRVHDDAGNKNTRKFLVTCEVCGKTVERIVNNYRPPKTCGSEECVSESIRRSKLGKNHPNWSGEDILVKCNNCGKEFYKRKWQIKDHNFCCKDCHNKYMSTSGIASRKERIEKICPTCGKHFFVKPSEMYTRKYCSQRCSGKSFTGKKNPNWRGGKSYGDYCEKFNNDFRERVRAFFGNKCVVCGKEHNDAYGSRVSVHHVNFNKKACCDQTEKPLFVTLCAGCHNKTNGKYQKEYWEDYFKKLINEKYGGKCYYTKEEYYNLFK